MLIGSDPSFRVRLVGDGEAQGPRDALGHFTYWVVPENVQLGVVMSRSASLRCTGTVEERSGVPGPPQVCREIRQFPSTPPEVTLRMISAGVAIEISGKGDVADKALAHATFPAATSTEK